MRLSLCNRFYVFDALFLDREVGLALLEWCEKSGVRPQDGVQLAVLALTREDPSSEGPAAEKFSEQQLRCESELQS